jgi:hypothetical protein
MAKNMKAIKSNKSWRKNHIVIHRPYCMIKCATSCGQNQIYMLNCQTLAW